MSARVIAAVLLAACALRAIATESSDAAMQRADQVLRESFSGATPEQWRTGLGQDEAQRLCSRFHDMPPPTIGEKIAAEAHASMRYPQSGKLIGDWREGEKLASTVAGGRISTIQPEPADRKHGGNCYACHALAPGEVAAGNLGPSLTRYGKLRGNSPETIKFVYEKIYNAQASFPCSLMPRFGRNAWLTPEQIADAVAFLLDPESPVNK
jgi:sulfur-oxidizing protein SoxX